MKIGITCYPTYGGSGVVATELGKKLAESGHEVHFISYAIPYRLNSFHSRLFFHEVKVLEYSLFEHTPYCLSLASKMAEIAEFAHLDILHVHYAIPHATSAYLAREMIKGDKLKFVTTLHGTDITLIGSDPSYSKIVEFSIDQSNGVTAVSKYLKTETKKVFNIKKPIEVIYNFIPDQFLNVRPSTDLKSCFKPDGQFVLTHISNFRPVKRTPDLLEIIKILIKKDKKYKLVLVGDGPDRSKLEFKCRELELCEYIIFLGKQDNIAEILNASDLFLMTSETESFGLAALEALACGVPCITTNTGGLKEVNIHGETGYITDVGNIEAFAEYIGKIKADSALYKKLSKNAKKYALSNFRSDRIVPQYVAHYEQVLAR
ncbi:MAG: N-acetyl-alpha-D-glucosaminyl L-malate synthase BshA [Calditrichaceae bacterium]|nr:N-acetyl-alpha-D-glucosaminyl L-malate synthase BshA [Calditrichaceae bacterium]MBN2709151.1 N-acetyl-alpha-D-glucosaminyl L-malate synthase BshA [Calditrichaceae bacterium]RQV96107.1 MAG: N-acetyl-alpha-D-glucosaminyl L-malate synthase BshA [Calditrichota bacterium]